MKVYRKARMIERSGYKRGRKEGREGRREKERLGNHYFSYLSIYLSFFSFVSERLVEQNWNTQLEKKKRKTALNSK